MSSKWLPFLILVYRVLLDILYVETVYPFYAYIGFLKNDTFETTLISWIFLIFFIPFIVKMNKRSSTFSTSVMTLFFCMSVIPTTTLIRYLNFDVRFVFLIFFYWLFFFLYMFFFPKFKTLSAKTGNRRVITFLAILLSSVVVGISGIYTGFRFHFTLFDVYDLREEASNFNIPLIINYLHAAAGKLLPVLAVFYLAQKKYKIVAILVVVMLLNFGIGGHKSVFFSLFLAIIGFYFFRYSRMIFAYWGFIVINFLALVEFLTLKTFSISVLMINRVLLTPSQLNYFYYDYFKDRELDYMRQGFLRWFNFTSPYKQNIAYIIGGEYFGDDKIMICLLMRILILVFSGLFFSLLYSFVFLNLLMPCLWVLMKE